jgi:hypothetical protein
MKFVPVALCASAVAVAGLAGGAAHAATIVSFSNYQTALNPGEVLVTDFDGPAITVPAGFATGGTAGVMPGTSSSGAAPAFSPTTVDTTQYLSVGAGETFTLTSPALSEISFYVGSLDPYNSITFTGAGGFSQTFTGNQLTAATIAADLANGSQQAASSNGRYTFTFDQAVTAVLIGSSSPAFEISNIGAIPAGDVGLVPEPAAWALMLFGFGGLGAGLRAQRRSKLHIAAI